MRPGRRSPPGCAGLPGTTCGSRADRDRLLQPIGDGDEDGRARRDADRDADALGDLTRAESIEALREAVLTLPVRYREAVVLCDLQEMTYADAGDVRSGVPSEPSDPVCTAGGRFSPSSSRPGNT